MGGASGVFPNNSMCQWQWVTLIVLGVQLKEFLFLKFATYEAVHFKTELLGYFL